MPATAAELDAILHGAAIAPISAAGYERFARAFLRITGSDATRWLNGMVTNSIQALQPGEGNYNFLLNAQGRIQADCTIYREPGDEPTFLLETDSSQLATVQETLDRFIIMDDVELSSGLEIMGHPAVGLSLLGQTAPALLSAVVSQINERDESEPPPQPKPGTMTCASRPRNVHSLFRQPGQGLLLVFTPPLFTLPRFDLWLQSEEDLQQLSKDFESQGGSRVSADALEAFRILSGTPRYGQDIRNSDTSRDLPQETNQSHALHFNKGCYVGQEIVERIRSRGQVHRLFTRFRLEGDLPASLPAPLQVDGKPAGELTSAALVPQPNDPQLLALGYARREFLETGKLFTYAQGTALPISASKSWFAEPL